jgi:hypothetical protein
MRIPFPIAAIRLKHVGLLRSRTEKEAKTTRKQANQRAGKVQQLERRKKGDVDVEFDSSASKRLFRRPFSPFVSPLHLLFEISESLIPLPC